MKIALFRTFREISCQRHLLGPGPGARSLNKQNQESALPHPGLPRPGPGAGAGGPEQGTGGPERGTGGPEQRPGGPEQRTGGPERAHSARSLNVLLRGASIRTLRLPGFRSHTRV